MQIIISFFFQPFCDGAHKDHPKKLKPVHFSPPKDGKFLLCRCKQTNNRPYCDLTHIKTCMSLYFLNLILYLAFVLSCVYYVLAYFYLCYKHHHNQNLHIKPIIFFVKPLLHAMT